jgi:hypothetical protein
MTEWIRSVGVWAAPLALAALGVWVAFGFIRRSAANALANAELPKAEELLRGIRLALGQYAESHGLRLPGAISELDLPDDLAEYASRLAFRPAPDVKCDERLILLYERNARFKVSEFAAVQPARLLMLLSGKIMLLSDGAFARLLQADNTVREKAGLEPVEMESH